MEQSLWEAISSSASQEVPYICWNPLIHFYAHRIPPSEPWAMLILFIPIYSVFWRSILLLSSHLHLGVTSGLLPSGSSNKTRYAPLLSPICAANPAYLILLDITRMFIGEVYRSCSSRYAVSSNPLVAYPTKSQIYSLAPPYSQTPSAFRPPLWETKFHIHIKEQEKLHMFALWHT
jgi:hypothetical protein